MEETDESTLARAPHEEEQRAVREGGGGEAEGFELAEQELIEHASHGDSGPDPSHLAGKPEEYRGGEAYGEADHERLERGRRDARTRWRCERGGEEPRGDLEGDRPAQRELPCPAVGGADEPVRGRAPRLGGDPRPAGGRRSRRSAPGRFRIVCSREGEGEEIEETEAIGTPVEVGVGADDPPLDPPSRPRTPAVRSRGRGSSCSEVEPELEVTFCAQMLSSVKPPVRIRTPIAIRIPPPVAMIAA